MKARGSINSEMISTCDAVGCVLKDLFDRGYRFEHQKCPEFKSCPKEWAMALLDKLCLSMFVILTSHAGHWNRRSIRHPYARSDLDAESLYGSR